MSVVLSDQIEIEEAYGRVLKVTMCSTVLNTFEISQLKIHNSTIGKSRMTNFTATRLRRKHFAIGMGVEDSITKTQEVLLIMGTGPAGRRRKFVL